MSWTKQFTPFSYSVFCVWRNQNEERKERIVVNIKELNALTQSDAYSLSLQIDIIALLRDCFYIIVIDCFAFFYQQRVHSSDKHKLIVILYHDQKSFNIAIIRYKNSSTYMQRQSDRLLRVFRKFARAYVDDIVIFSRTTEKHATHLREIFSTPMNNNLFIKLSKAFIEYSTVSLLDQKIDSLDLTIAKKKLRAISRLHFSQTLRQLKIFLDLIDWLRDYVSHYARIAKSLQNRKTELLRANCVVDSTRKNYFFKTRVQHSTKKKIAFFKTLQITLFKLSYLVHSNVNRQLFVDLNVNTEFDFETMLYYLKETYLQKTFADHKEYSPRHAIESILFLSRLITLVESRYWSTKLELARIVWVLKKMRHIVKVFFRLIIVYIVMTQLWDWQSK